MKTSDKILTGLLIFLIVIPFLVFMGFRSKILKGQFTVASQEEVADFTNPYGVPKKGVMGQKFIKITGVKIKEVENPSAILTCHLYYGPSPHYSYYRQDLKDSVSVTVLGDTTYVAFVGDPRRKTEGGTLTHLTTVDLYLPSWDGVIIDGASVILDDMEQFKWAKSQLVGFSLENGASLEWAEGHKGSINIGNNVDNDDKRVKDTVNNKSKTDSQLVKSASTQIKSIPDVEVTAEGGQIVLGDFVHFNQLALNLSKGGSFEIKNKFSAERISGHISDDVKIICKANAIDKFLTLLHVR